jgi:hypothetical protein
MKGWSNFVGFLGVLLSGERHNALDRMMSSSFGAKQAKTKRRPEAAFVVRKLLD